MRVEVGRRDEIGGALCAPPARHRRGAPAHCCRQGADPACADLAWPRLAVAHRCDADQEDRLSRRRVRGRQQAQGRRGLRRRRRHCHRRTRPAHPGPGRGARRRARIRRVGAGCLTNPRGGLRAANPCRPQGPVRGDTRALDAITMPTPCLIAAAASSWRRQVVARVATLWWVKMGSNVVGLAAFFVAYFWVLHHPQFQVTVMPLTWVDSAVAFEPAAMPLYVSLWVYVSLPLALLKDRRELASYGVATLALSVIGLAIFIACPTVAFLKAVDLAGNACPSLHVAFAAFSAVWLD